MIELRHLDVDHFVIEECRHPTNGCASKCSFAILSECNNMRYEDYMISFYNIGLCVFRICDALVASCTIGH